MQAQEQHNQLLNKHNLKKTVPRLSVLDILTSRKTAISQPQLELLLGKQIDRVTLYRTLNTFEENGIIHKVMGVNGTTNYAMCPSSCKQHQNHNHHVHFNCTVCFNLFCLDDIQVPDLAVPNGFKANKIELMISGVCEKCAN